MSSGTLTIFLSVLSLFGVLTVGVLVPLYLVGRAEKDRREDALEAARLHREDREAEWARQDKVAAEARAAAEAVSQRADKAAALLLERQNESVAAQQRVAAQAEEAARLLAENNELVAETAKETGKKLDTIHTLVNSNMTAAMESERAAVGRELAVMKELMELRKATGQQPSQEALSAITATAAKLRELEIALAERAKIQEQVNRKIGLDVITTTSYRQQGDDTKTSVEVNNETQGVGPPGDEPKMSAEYADEPPPEHGEP